MLYKKELQLTTLPELKLSTEFSKQLDYMLNSVSHTEWSGLLFYKYRGSVKDISKMSFELIGLYPLDVGSGAYTEYTMSNHMSDVIRLYDEYPEYMDCKVGHIHSHHSMGVFASGTDMETLLGCVTKKQFDMLLSVIVNNARQMFAGVAFTTKTEIRGTRTHKIVFDNEEFATIEPSYSHTIEGVVWTKCACKLDKLTSVRNPLSHIVSKLSGLLFSRPSYSMRNTPYNTSRQLTTGIGTSKSPSDEDLMKEFEQNNKNRNKPFIVDARNTPQSMLTDEELAYLILDNLYNISLNDYSALGLIDALRANKNYKFDVPLEEYNACVDGLYPNNGTSDLSYRYDAAKLVLDELNTIKSVPRDCKKQFTDLLTDIENLEATYYDFITKP